VQTFFPSSDLFFSRWSFPCSCLLQALAPSRSLFAFSPCRLLSPQRPYINEKWPLYGPRLFFLFLSLFSLCPLLFHRKNPTPLSSGVADALASPPHSLICLCPPFSGRHDRPFSCNPTGHDPFHRSRVVVAHGAGGLLSTRRVHRSAAVVTSPLREGSFLYMRRPFLVPVFFSSSEIVSVVVFKLVRQSFF